MKHSQDPKLELSGNLHSGISVRGSDTKHLPRPQTFALLLLSLWLIAADAIAAGQLMVSPTRIVFEGRDRTKQVNLINAGTETGRYRISFVQKRMADSGKLETLEPGTEGNFSDSMVRFSPRQVTLPPGKSQVVRLMLRKPRDLAEGEYRSHMLFQSIPDPVSSSVESLTGSEKGLKINLIPIVGISIPIIVEHGKLSASASLGDFELNPGNAVKPQPLLSMTMHREGTRSVYGDFRISFTPAGGVAVIVGQINGVAIYSPNSKRKLEMALQPPTGTSLANGELHITYLEPGKDAKTGLIAEAKLTLP